MKMYRWIDFVEHGFIERIICFESGIELRFLFDGEIRVMQGLSERRPNGSWVLEI